MNYDMQNSLIIDGVYQRGKHRSSGWTIILIPGLSTEKKINTLNILEMGLVDEIVVAIIQGNVQPRGTDQGEHK